MVIHHPDLHNRIRDTRVKDQIEMATALIAIEDKVTRETKANLLSVYHMVKLSRLDPVSWCSSYKLS